MTNPKVFEFAKEIGMTPLALMDRIKEWHLPVKSHMSELEPEVILLIRQKIGGGAKQKNSVGEKKTTARKKAATPKATPAPLVTKVSSKATAKAAMIKEKEEEAKLASNAPAAATTVVRRKKVSEVDIKTQEKKIEEAPAISSIEKTEEISKKHSLQNSAENVMAEETQPEAKNLTNLTKNDQIKFSEELKTSKDLVTEKEEPIKLNPQIQENEVSDKSFPTKESFISEEVKKGDEKELNKVLNTSLHEIKMPPPPPPHSSSSPDLKKEILKNLGKDIKESLQHRQNDPHQERKKEDKGTLEIKDSKEKTTAVTASGSPAPGSSSHPIQPPNAQASHHSTQEESAVQEKKNIIRKKEVTIGASGVGSDKTPQSIIGRKNNIIGRMDLSRVQSPYQARGPGSSGNGERTVYTARSPNAPGPFVASGNNPISGGGMGTGMSGRPKGNIRAGFVSTAPTFTDFQEQEDYSRKKDEKRRYKGTASPEVTTPREVEDQPPVFDAAEFRKREMVFQPKKKKGLLNRPSLQTQITTPGAKKRVVKINGIMKVSVLAQELGIKAADLIKVLMKNGLMANMNTDLDFDTISLVVPEFNFEAQSIQKSPEEMITEFAFGDLNANPVVRAPIVTVMGHVDHGKTSLLDVIRTTNVASKEAGGITQHIGAYQVKLDDGFEITFLDTPGHEAFTAMRARGANVTDVAIIVVAADDGVMPQTIEAINHAKAAKVPLIIAVNKIDKPGANVEKIKQQLTEYEIVPEEWGGQHIFCEVSALKKTGIKELLEQIKLLSEILELKANPLRSGNGIVIESRLERGRGSVATILVQDGTVSIGQYVVAGSVTGRIRGLMNHRGERIQTAGPGMPVEVLGLDEVPQAGDKFDVVKDEQSAEGVAKIRKELSSKSTQSTGKISLEELFAKVQRGDVKDLNVILKADVAGSLEALQGMFSKISTPEVIVKLIHSGVGGITETDVLLASSAKGLIIGFNVRPDNGAIQSAKSHNIEIRTYSIVYELMDEMRKAMVGLLQPDIVEKIMGRAEVRNLFSVPKIGVIAGCFIIDGKVARSNLVRLIRDGKIIYEGKISSLKRFKDDAREVMQGFECGIGIENFNDVKMGDIIEAYIKEEVARELTVNKN